MCVCVCVCVCIEREFQTGAVGEGVEDMEFPRVLKKYHVEILGVK